MDANLKIKSAVWNSSLNKLDKIILEDGTECIAGGNKITVVAPVESDKPAGTIASGTKISLSCATTGSTIFYTLTGATPTLESTRYTGKIKIDETKTIKAVAYKDGCLASEPVTFEYIVE